MRDSTRRAPRSACAHQREDVPLLLELFGELAEYEHLADELRATEALLGEALFGERPAAEALIAERDGDTLGYAVFFPTFSTFLAIQGIWLEDLFVRPEHRGARGRPGAARGGRRARARARRRATGMVGAATGTSSRSASTGAWAPRRMDEWITHRLIGEALERLAARGRTRARARRRR